MYKRNRFLSGLAAVMLGLCVLLTLCLPTSCLIFILGIALVWCGIKLMCR